jgi:hypothetical protein
MKYWLFCDVYLCRHQQKQILAKNNTQKTVAMVKNLFTEVKPCHMRICVTVNELTHNHILSLHYHFGKRYPLRSDGASPQNDRQIDSFPHSTQRVNLRNVHFYIASPAAWFLRPNTHHPWESLRKGLDEAAIRGFGD